MQDQAKQTTLLTRIGGAGAVDTLVGALYFNILNDPRLARFFEHVPVSRVVAHQRQFLMMALDSGKTGTSSPPGKNERWLAHAHSHLIETHGLDYRHFDAVIENLEMTLRDLEVPEADAREVVAVLAATRTQIFCG